MKLSENQQKELIHVLKLRFEKNINRHLGLEWNKIQPKLEGDLNKLSILFKMEQTEGEPDVIGFDEKTNKYIFVIVRLNLQKEDEVYVMIKKHLIHEKNTNLKNNALDLANEIGIEILNEQQYKELQMLGKFDTKTSSWIITPQEIRNLGGALFCDYRYGNVFTYHNGAESYYASRGFRGILKV